jgi:hypothetical protein
MDETDQKELDSHQIGIKYNLQQELLHTKINLTY